MVPNSQAEKYSTNDVPIELIFQIRELYGRTTYSHKVHEKCADIYFQRQQVIKIIQILLAALTTGSLLIAIFGGGKIGTIMGAACSTILFGLNMYMKDYDLGEISQKHSNIASRLWDVRESYLSILTDLSSARISLEEASQKRDELQEKLSSIFYNSPRTTKSAYKNAQKALKLNEEMTFTNEEIDQLLPEAFRTSNGHTNG